MNCTSVTGSVLQISKNLFLYPSTCHVYILRSGSSAVLIDFGDGSVLDVLPSLAITQVTDVLMTHHHRDQGQGLPLAMSHGIRIWVPEVERELFEAVDDYWLGRPVYNNYNMRQDRFSLLHSTAVDGLLEDYAVYALGGFQFEVLPAPGHTPGSLALLTEIDGQRVAFTGDLIAGPGKVWSLAATQWTYNGAEGASLSALSMAQLMDRSLDLLLPSHGEIITDPQAALDLTFQRLRALLDARMENTRMVPLLRDPFSQITPHLLMNQTGACRSYALLSQSGKALLVDYGYDFVGAMAPGADRAAHRPWLYTLPTLKQSFGVSQVDVVIPTHYHDDHVAGMNLLRRVEGTQVWIPENFVEVMENPAAFDLPCLWYDPIPADRVLPLEMPLQWEEYTLWVYAFPGHTRYAAAIFMEVDGQRVLFTGDQYQGESGLKWNYVYQNRFEIQDYVRSVELYERLAPDILLSGHWNPVSGSEAYFRRLREDAAWLEALHRDLLPLETLNLGAEGIACHIQPYQAQAAPGETLVYQVCIRNPLHQSASAWMEWVLPEGWQVDPPTSAVSLAPGEQAVLSFTVCVPADSAPARRIRLAVDVTVGGLRLGQQAECLVDLLNRRLSLSSPSHTDRFFHPAA